LLQAQAPEATLEQEERKKNDSQRRMNMSTPRYLIIGLTGSLRKHSVNQGVLRAVQELLPGEARMEILSRDGLPHYNMDLEDDEPEAVRHFKAKLSLADAVFIATPEFNSSVPGVLKNALDWASRPFGRSVMAGKPVAITGAGGRGGTASAQAHLRSIFRHFGVPISVLVQPEVYLANVWEKFDANGDLKDQTSRERLRDLLEALLEAVRAQEMAA